MALLEAHGWLAELLADYEAGELDEPLNECMEQLASAWHELNQLDLNQLALLNLRRVSLFTAEAVQIVESAHNLYLKDSLERLEKSLANGSDSLFYRELPIADPTALRVALDSHMNSAKSSGACDKILSCLLQKKLLSTHEVIEYVFFLQACHGGNMKLALEHVIPILASITTGALISYFVSPILGGTTMVTGPIVQYLCDSPVLAMKGTVMRMLFAGAKQKGIIEFRKDYREVLENASSGEAGFETE